MRNSTTKKLVMVSSRFGGKEENIERAERFCKYVVNMGHIPVAPHVYFPRFLDDLNAEERELGIEGALALMSKCDEVWFFLQKGEKLSQGMKLEAQLMVEMNMPYKVVDADLVDFILKDIEFEKITLNYKPEDVAFDRRYFDSQFDDKDWHLIYRNNDD